MTGSAIKRLRRKLGLSQEQLARMLGVSTTTVHRWETTNTHGPRGLELVVLQAMQQAIDRVPDFCGTDLSTWMEQGVSHMILNLFVAVSKIARK